MAVNMSYPKPVNVMTKVAPIARTDNGTIKMVIPKDSIVLDVQIILSTACAGTTATIGAGYSGAATALVNAFNVSTADAGVHGVAGRAGADVIAGTRQTADRQITTTYAAGDSAETTGALGYIRVDFAVLGPGETLGSS